MSYSDSLPFLYTSLPRTARFIGSSFFVLANAPVSWLMFSGGAVPIDKHVPDVQAARRILRLLAAGDVVALFPEGERSWAGVPIDPVMPCAKFLARLKVPIIIAEIRGSYDHWPRWERTPRWRSVTVRLRGPVKIPGHIEARADPNQQPKWWASVYRAGGRVDGVRASAYLAASLHDASRGEASRLDLLRKGRFRQISRLICYCPECACPGPESDARRLVCAACGAAWLPAAGGALRRENAPANEAPELLSDLFLQMLETLRRNAPKLVPLEESVAVAVLNGRKKVTVPAHARLESGGIIVKSHAKTWEVQLEAMANGVFEGFAVLEIHACDGTPLALTSDGGGLRLVLAARALLGLSWGPFIGKAPVPPRGELARA